MTIGQRNFWAAVGCALGLMTTVAATASEAKPASPMTSTTMQDLVELQLINPPVDTAFGTQLALSPDASGLAVSAGALGVEIPEDFRPETFDD